MMTPPFAVLLVVGAVVVFALVLRKIRRSEIAVADSVFWFFFALSLVVLAAFPGIAFKLSEMLGFMSVVNFVFLYVIAVLVVKVFFMAVEIAKLRAKQAELVEEKALSDLALGRFGGVDGTGVEGAALRADSPANATARTRADGEEGC
ncbi:MAG: DUF2304 domain-containing protein [Eggerthellaceae bacterium]|nr:DUF2304 domain-containing protein [Eggerthellaceae bacterium]